MSEGKRKKTSKTGVWEDTGERRTRGSGGMTRTKQPKGREPRIRLNDEKKKKKKSLFMSDVAGVGCSTARRRCGEESIVA